MEWVQWVLIGLLLVNGWISWRNRRYFGRLMLGHFSYHQKIISVRKANKHRKKGIIR